MEYDKKMDAKNNLHDWNNISSNSIDKQQESEVNGLDTKINVIFPNDTKKVTSNRRRVRVRFVYSLDNDQNLPRIQTTVIKNEPYFKINTTEDQIVRRFYQNESKQHLETPTVQQKTLIEQDSLEDDDFFPLEVSFY